jgi:uncharacterized protein
VGREILVDGYNIIKNDPSLHATEVKNFAAARKLLIDLLVNRYRHTPHQVIVVFDGDGASEQVSHDRRVRIIYSRYGQTADRVIMRLAAEAHAAGREVEMFSNDGEIRAEVARQGGSVRSTGQLTSQLNTAPRDVALRAQHRIKMKRAYGLDPAYDPGDEPEARKTKGGKKKHSRRKW